MVKRHGRCPADSLRRAAGRAGAGPDVLAFRADAGGQAGRQVQRAARPQRAALAGGAAPRLARRPRWRGCASSSSGRCKDNEFWRGHELARRRPSSWSATACGAARMKKARCSSTSTSTRRTSPRTCCRCSAVTGDWLTARAEEAVDAGRKEHRRAVGPAATEQGRARAAAVRHAGALPARPAQHAGRVQGQQRAGGVCGHRRDRRRERRPKWARRCAPARGSSASAWSRT